MNTPYFSIIIPVYNVEKYLSQCLDSILEQSFGDYELILINDGSKDNSLNICQNYSKRDNSCLLYTSPSPRDRSVSRMPSSA